MTIITQQNRPIYAQLHAELVPAAVDEIITYSAKNGFKNTKKTTAIFFLRIVEFFNKLCNFVGINWKYANQAKTILLESKQAHDMLIKLEVPLYDKYKSKNHVRASYVDKNYINSLPADLDEKVVIPKQNNPSIASNLEQASTNLNNAKTEISKIESGNNQISKKEKKSPNSDDANRDIPQIDSSSNQNQKTEQESTNLNHAKTEISKIESENHQNPKTEQTLTNSINQIENSQVNLNNSLITPKKPQQARKILDNLIKQGVVTKVSENEIKNMNSAEVEMVTEKLLIEHKAGELLMYTNITGSKNLISVNGLMHLLATNTEQGQFCCPYDNKNLFKIDLDSGEIINNSPIKFGTCPPGIMKINYSNESLPSDNNIGRYEIKYIISNEQHSNKKLTEVTHLAYIPATEKGTLLLTALIIAWKHKLIFDATSHNSDTKNTYALAIHHQTLADYNLPDSGYIDNTLKELAAKGLTQDLITKNLLASCRKIKNGMKLMFQGSALDIKIKKLLDHNDKNLS